jgi:hypothetical protein
MNVTPGEPNKEHLLMFVIGGNQPRAEFTPLAMQRCREFAEQRAQSGQGAAVKPVARKASPKSAARKTTARQAAPKARTTAAKKTAVKKAVATKSSARKTAR